MFGREWISPAQSFIELLDQLFLIPELNPFGYVKICDRRFPRALFCGGGPALCPRRGDAGAVGVAGAAEVVHETASTMWHWMLGRLFSMTALGVMTAIGLWLLGVPLPIALGFLSGIMLFVPYICSVVSAVLSVVIAVSINFTLAICVIGLYIAVHQIEGYILDPLVQRRVKHLPPALTLCAQIILGFLADLLVCCSQPHSLQPLSSSYGWSISRMCSAIARPQHLCLSSAAALAPNLLMPGRGS
jgi:hypothetical protein